MAHYVASKGAITVLTRTLARELGEHDVCVNMLSPGFTLSDTVVAGNPALVGAAKAPSVATRSLHRDKGEVLPTDLPGATSMGLRVPAGVVLSMAPWNAPLVLAMRAMAFPVAYGNTVVLKASGAHHRRVVWAALEALGAGAGRQEPAYRSA
ncbi:aldehyde dehydrogenase family protein [Amycolatopsis sp. H6(2020)]|nr:aldehyde dehydrogenase family protein [Amycolatopsis sp. H6(2020)]